MNTEPLFELLRGGKPAPHPVEEPNPDAPIDLGLAGTYDPKLERLRVALPGGYGMDAFVHCSEANARHLGQIIDGRGLRAVFSEDFNDARRALVERCTDYCLAASRDHKGEGHVALWLATRSGRDGSALWREVAAFDRHLSGLAAAFALEMAGAATGPAPDHWRFDLWSVPKMRMRCGLHLRNGNKEGTTIEARSFPPELSLDWQILCLATPILRASAVA